MEKELKLHQKRSQNPPRRVGNIIAEWKDKKNDTYEIEEFISEKTNEPYYKTTKLSDNTEYAQNFHRFGACKKYVCNCLGYVYTGECKHIKALRRIRNAIRRKKRL